MVQFKTKQDAIDAGYRLVNKRFDKDVSGYPYFGYTFENEVGVRTEDVLLSKIGKYCPMFPPGGD